jgi:multidrug resistance protein
LRIARKASLLVIFLTVFMDLVGFGIVLPMLPWYSKEFGASGLMAGCIVASYSLMQFIFAPMWGRLSDRIGRRPVLLISTAGACVSYTVFAFACGAGSIWLLLASRMAAGICGANLSVASAYIADVSLPEERSQRMGLIGMAFGLGFIFGPVLGALSAGWFGATGPGWTAATICGLNFILAFFILGESRQPSSDPVPPAPRLAQYARIMKRSQLGYLIGVFFLATFCFTCFESTFAVLFAGTKNSPGNFSYVTAITVEPNPNTHTPIDWMITNQVDVMKGDLLAVYGEKANRINLTAPISGRADLNSTLSLIPRKGSTAGIVLGTIDTTKNYAYWLMAFCGIIGAIVQGACIGPLVKFCGEKWMIVAGLALVGVSLALLPFCNDSRGLIFLMACLALFAVSSSIYRAPTFGLISLNASAAEQGEIMGVTQSIGSMARIIGPLFALSLMDLRLELPYLICALVAIIASILALLLIIPPSKEVLKPDEPETKTDRVKQPESSSDEKAKAPVRIQLPVKKDKPKDEPAAS